METIALVYSIDECLINQHVVFDANTLLLGKTMLDATRQQDTHNLYLVLTGHAVAVHQRCGLHHFVVYIYHHHSQWSGLRSSARLRRESRSIVSLYCNNA